MKIDNEVQEAILKQIEALLKDYAEEIDAAYCAAEKALRIGLSVTLEPKGSGIMVSTKINTVAKKITDTVKYAVGIQYSLPGM